jgi:peptidoglycan/LPS O-acetylase OafA/YrhL
VTADQKVPRVESLTGLRWWAAFFVFTHHMSNLAPLPIAGFLRLGISGVTFFFVLSGFVLTWSASPALGTGAFYWRRVARIGPSHLVATLLALPVFYTLSTHPDHSWVNPLDLAAIALSLVLLQGWSDAPAVHFAGNPAAWTLSVEAFFYAGHPLYNRILRRASPRVALGGAVVLMTGVGAAWCWWPAMRGFPAPVQHLPAFLLGMMLATAIRAGWRPRLPTPIALGVLGGGLVAAWQAEAHPHAPGAALLNAVQPALLAVLYAAVIVAAAARDLTGRRSILRSRPLVALGQWSYGFYLIHATLVYAIRSVTGVFPAGWSNLAIYLAVLVPAALGSWALYAWVERPAERRLRPLAGTIPRIGRQRASGTDQGAYRGGHRGAEAPPAATLDA